MKFNKVKGTEDFYPEDKELQKQIFNILRSTVNNYGFKEVESSVMETTSLLTAKSGEEIKSQIF
ncbi:histidine--tRNA ligase, partial [Nanoarchaeota archaeon]